MERLKSVLSFAAGLAVLLAFMFGVTALVSRFGLFFVLGVYVVMYLALLVAFLLFAPGLRRK